MSVQPVTTFTMLETGWKTVAKPEFRAAGAALAVDLRGFTQPARKIGNPASGSEEFGAVLEGEFVLCSDEDVYELQAGQAVLIPPGAAREWRLVSASGTLYRVWRRMDAAP